VKFHTISLCLALGIFVSAAEGQLSLDEAQLVAQTAKQAA
jgi:hypothetical protein